ncbi:hypothetical protein [Glycomyces tarimensis]
MNAMPPEEPDRRHAPEMSSPVPPAPQPEQPPSVRPQPDSPSPVGLIVAGAGLILLCLSVLLPRVAIDLGGEADLSYFGFTQLSGEQFGIDTATVLLSVALLCVVGLSASRVPALRWPSRLAAVGIAALTAAFAYHPVTVLRQTFEAYESDDPSGQIDVSADNGMYIALFAVLLLAVSAFLMQRRSPEPVDAQPTAPAPPPPPGVNPTIKVTPDN